MADSSLLDMVVPFPDKTIATEGLHAGVIESIVPLGPQTIKGVTHDWIRIWVGLTDQADANGAPLRVGCDVTLTSYSVNSHLLTIFKRLGFKPSKDFTLSKLIGVEVDAFVTHEPGKVKGNVFANVNGDDLYARGKGVARAIATEVPESVPVVVSKWMNRKLQGGAK